MGFAVAYETTEKISKGLQHEILDAACDIVAGRTWLSCEPLLLSNNDGHLIGVSKPNFSPHPDDVASAKSEGLPDGTLNDLIDGLCMLSAKFGIDWEISHDYSDGPLGYIRSGLCDDQVRIQCDALNDLANELLGGDFDLDDL